MNVPKLRFKGFKGEWENRLLADIASFGRGKGISKGDLSEFGEPCILYGELYTKYNEVATTIYSKTDIENSDLIRTEKLDVLIPASGETAEDIACATCVIQEGVLIGGDLNILSFGEKVDGRFISYQINSIKKRELAKYAQGATVIHLYNQGIKKLNLKIPKLEEQGKIADFLFLLDKKIQLQQEKIDLLQKQKKGFLQKMFPKAGKVQPEWRFDGFYGEWKEMKIGDLAQISRGASPRPIQDPKWFDETSNIGWLRISDVTKQNGRIHYLEQKLSKLGQQKTRVIEKPHLLLSIAATVGKPVINYIPTGVHDGFLIFYTPLFDIEYMFQWLEMFRNNWRKYGQPGSQVNLNSELVRNQKIIIPSITEQEKIARFLAMIDKKIRFEEEKLMALQQKRQGFMQQMFI